MAEINVTRTLETTPAALWEIVRAFDDVRWMPDGGGGCEVEGEGVGQVRMFDGPNGKIHEHLVARDDAAQSLTYTIPQGIPFPVTGYRSTMVVSDDGGQGALSWTCEFEPDGATEAEAGAAVTQMYEVMIGWIADLLKKG